MDKFITRNILNECRNVDIRNESDIAYLCQFCDKKVVGQTATRVESVCSTSGRQHSNLDVELLRCHDCNKDVAICHKDYWLSVSDYLHGSVAYTGIKQVQTASDRRILFLLSQVFYNQYDLDLDNNNLQSPFGKFSDDEFSHLLWIDGEAVGFYTVKETGSPVYEDGVEVYQLPVLDTMYVRSEFRHQGLGTKLLQDFCTHYPNQNVGFSSPVSMSFYKVLYKFLLDRPELKDKMWECEFDGSEGYRKNIWFHIRRIFKQLKRKTPAKEEKPIVAQRNE